MGSAAIAKDLGCMLAQASHVLMTELVARLGKLGISQRHYCVLSRALDEELTQIRLAEMCGLDKTTMVVTMDELEKAGLAERRPSASDRRARIVSVTTAGKELVDTAEDVVAQVYSEVLGVLPAGEREAFLSGLERLVSTRLATPVHCDRPVRRRSPKA